MKIQGPGSDSLWYDQRFYCTVKKVLKQRVQEVENERSQYQVSRCFLTAKSTRLKIWKRHPQCKILRTLGALRLSCITRKLVSLSTSRSVSTLWLCLEPWFSQLWRGPDRICTCNGLHYRRGTPTLGKTNILW